MSVYVQILDSIQNGKKGVMSGQMSLFDIVSEEEKAELEIKMPDVGEYDKELLLSFEKEVLGFYVSGHPMEEYEALWSKYITARLRTFIWMKRHIEPWWKRKPCYHRRYDHGQEDQVYQE